MTTDHPTPPTGPSGISAALEAEPIGGPPLDHDEQLRVEALRSAAIAYQGLSNVTDEDIVVAAGAFEAYLRGDQ